MKKKITFDAVAVQRLEEASRAQGRSLPELVRRAVDTFLDPQSIAVTVDPSMAEQLEAISRAAPHGRVSVTDMIQRAIEEFAAARLQTPEVQQVLTSMRGAALRLVPRVSRADDSSPVGDIQNN